MYKNFFGLRENPFNINPDPRFLHRTPRIQEALDQLTYGVQSRKGLLLLTGEVGTGKTTLINHLLDWLRQQQIPTAFIFNSHLNVNHLFDFILNDFGISADYHLVSNMLLELNRWLLKRFREGSTPVLIIDEAQGLSLELLEEIRLLLNLETASEKLLQIVLVGQPELEEKLKRPEMRQLRQRIALRCNTGPLSFEESRGYIADRLRVAGATRQPIFESDAIEALHHYSRGIPRVMNLLCEHALVNAYVEGLNPVPARMVEEAASDVLMEQFRPLSSRHSSTLHIDGTLSILHSERSTETGRFFRAEVAGSREELGLQRNATPVGFAEEEREPTGGETVIATAPEEAREANQEKRGSAVLEAGLEASLSPLDLVPTSPELGTQQANHSIASNPSTAQSDCAAELAATMGRLLAAASSPPAPQRAPSKVETERSPALRLASTGSRRGAAIPATIWLVNAVRVLQTVRETTAASGVVLRQWRHGFIHDWKLSVTALNLPRMKKSVGHWLQQPFSAKPMTSRKSQTI
jgi:general secretion pathway protein A